MKHLKILDEIFSNLFKNGYLKQSDLPKNKVEWEKRLKSVYKSLQDMSNAVYKTYLILKNEKLSQNTKTKKLKALFPFDEYTLDIILENEDAIVRIINEIKENQIRFNKMKRNATNNEQLIIVDSDMRLHFKTQLSDIVSKIDVAQNQGFRELVDTITGITNTHTNSFEQRGGSILDPIGMRKLFREDGEYDTIAGGLSDSDKKIAMEIQAISDIRNAILFPLYSLNKNFPRLMKGPDILLNLLLEFLTIAHVLFNTAIEKLLVGMFSGGGNALVGVIGNAIGAAIAGVGLVGSAPITGLIPIASNAIFGFLAETGGNVFKMLETLLMLWMKGGDAGPKFLDSKVYNSALEIFPGALEIDDTLQRILLKLDRSLTKVYNFTEGARVVTGIVKDFTQKVFDESDISFLTNPVELMGKIGDVTMNVAPPFISDFDEATQLRIKKSWRDFVKGLSDSKQCYFRIKKANRHSTSADLAKMLKECI